jgi:PhnB protein
MILEAYLFFYGRCEEALEFYQQALGGTYQLRRNGEMPEESRPPMPEGWERKVMHATFEGPGFRFMASDGPVPSEIDAQAGNITLSLGCEDPAEGGRVFAALAEGGTVKVPLSPVSWGGSFGVLHDRFGIEWMMTTS